MTEKIEIRNIRAKHIGKEIEIKGKVIKISEISAIAKNIRFECPNCNVILHVEQKDHMLREPNKCVCGWENNFMMLSKEFMDTRKITIQEFVRNNPKTMNIVLIGDLCSPENERITSLENEVKIRGVLEEVPIPLMNGNVSTRFDWTMKAKELEELR